MALQSIVYHPANTSISPATPPTLSILDQLSLPHAPLHVPLSTAASAHDAIRAMRVRGAPAIAIVAILAVAVESYAVLPLHGPPPAGPKEVVEGEVDEDRGLRAVSGPAMRDWFVRRLQMVAEARPTAVNLREATGRLEGVVVKAAAEIKTTEISDEGAAEEVRGAYVRAAEHMLEADVRDNVAIGGEGARWITEQFADSHNGQDEFAVLTHCNTGSLATAGHGTALGIIRTLHSQSQSPSPANSSLPTSPSPPRLSQVFYTETRPYNQGSRLTGYELIHDSIPCTLIPDSAAGWLLRTHNPPSPTLSNNGPSPSTKLHPHPRIAAIIVGADRVAANGDTANKIGTYPLALLARRHGARFVVAAPRTTIDLSTPCGAAIDVEIRAGEEVLEVRGPRVALPQPNGAGKGEAANGMEETEIVTVRTAARDTQAWNPAFDVTPHELVDAIVTEVGVVEKDERGRFDLHALFERGVKRRGEILHGGGAEEAKKVKSGAVNAGTGMVNGTVR